MLFWMHNFYYAYNDEAINFVIILKLLYILRTANALCCSESKTKNAAKNI